MSGNDFRKSSICSSDTDVPVGLFGLQTKTAPFFGMLFRKPSMSSLRLNVLYDFSSTSYVHYEMTMRHLDFLDHILVGEKPLRFNQLSNRLYIDMDWNEDIDADEFLIIECYRKLDPSSHTNIFDDLYLKRYTTALIKRQWGQNLSKFSGTAMLGGVTLNGPELFSTALQEQQKLEEEIRTNYEEPPHIMQG